MTVMFTMLNVSGFLASLLGNFYPSFDCLHITVFQCSCNKSTIVPNNNIFDSVLWLGNTADTLNYITTCQESNSTTGNQNLPQNNGRPISLVYAKLLKLTRECCTFLLCRYTLSDYYTMLSWICIPATGKEYYWEPSCWHPRSGMTRQVREICDEKLFYSRRCC